MFFRNDIQELRGIAFSLVLLYHLNSNLNPGGFVGVDIFFVISGYIITSSLSPFRNEKDRLIIFYARRIKRLFPSSYVCLLYCYYWHPLIAKRSKQEIQLFYDIISALLCCSNLRFNIVTQSYFQNEIISLILNYWSLSLEEQFYILYGLFYFYIGKRTILVVILFISFYFCVINTYLNKSSSYYILSNRSWEIILGCIATNYQLNIMKDSKVLVFYLIILSYIIGYYNSLKFPGFIALFPVVLTSVILILKDNKLFDSPLFQLIGNMSYVLYLFHYPIIHNFINRTNIVICIIYLFVISYFIYSLLELPIKKTNRLLRVCICSCCLLLLLLILLLSSIKQNKKSIYLIENNKIICSNKNKCSLNYTSIKGKIIILIGDSHLYQLLPVFNSLLYSYKVDSIVFLQMWTINIQENYISLVNYFFYLRNIILCIISLYVDNKFRYTNTERFDNNFRYFIKNILNISKGIIIIQDNPHRIRKNDTKCKQCLLPIINNTRITYINIFEVYCKGIKKCIENIYSKEIFLDMHHLSLNFVCNSGLIYNLLRSAFTKYLQINYHNSTTLCYEINLMMDYKRNLKFRKEFNFSVIKFVRFNEFGFATFPIFT